MIENIDLTHVLVLDIETVPQYENFEDVPEVFQELWAKKTSFQRKEEETPSDFYKKAGILAEFGKVICISVGVFDNKHGDLKLRVKSFYGDDEKVILEQFSGLLAKQSPLTLLCAHNGKEFDYPYLSRRIIINNLPLPKQLKIAGKKPWEVPHLDTMELWRFGDYKNFTSLNLLANIFDIPTPKDDIDGSMVKDVYYKEKNLARIVNYCQKDVITTAQILLRFKNSPSIPIENITIVE
ncbi:MAG: 3'-5' exonuclease [Sphingobacteriaceae bacterium]|nr:3'-5' exonuclease [Sphingobacteriaceae bacterium]